MLRQPDTKVHATISSITIVISVKEVLLLGMDLTSLDAQDTERVTSGVTFVPHCVSISLAFISSFAHGNQHPQCPTLRE